MMMNREMLLNVQEKVDDLLDLQFDYEDKTSEISRLETSLMETIISSTCYFVEIRGGLHWDDPDTHYDLVVGKENAYRKAKEYCGRVWSAILGSDGELYPSDVLVHDENWD